MADEWEDIDSEWEDIDSSPVPKKSNSSVMDVPTKVISNPFQSALKSVTGKSVSDYVDNSGLALKNLQTNQKLYGDNPLSRFKSIAENTITDLGAQTADGALTPSSYALVPALKLVGKGAGAVGDVSSKLWNNVKTAVELNKRLPDAKTLMDASERLTLQKENLNTASQLLSNTTSLDIRNKQGLIKNMINSMNTDVKTIAGQIGQQSKALATTLKTEIGKKVSSTQDAIPNFFRDAGKAYGQTLDNIIDSIDGKIGEGLLHKNAPVATKKEVFDSLNNVLNQGADDPLIANSRPYIKIKALAEKYNPESIIESGIVDAKGVPIIKDIGSDPVNLKNLLAEMRDINKSVSAGVRGGSKTISPEDLTVSRFNHSVGEMVKSRVPAFKDLQDSYSPVMKAKELAYKTFKPSKGDFATNSAEAFFKRVSFKDKISGQDQALLDMLEQGTTVRGAGDGLKIQGIGDISSELRSIGNKISSLTEDKASKQLALTSGKSLDINSLQSQIRKLQDNKNMFNIEKLKRVNDLNKRLMVVDKALHARKQIQDLKRNVSISAAGAAGLGILGKIGVNSLFKGNPQ